MGGREPGEVSWGITCYILFIASQWGPKEGGSCVLLNLLKKQGERGCWRVQLANGLRLMKWIMRGANADFCAKKRRRGRDCCTLTCSGLICQGLTPCQKAKGQRTPRLGQYLLPRQPPWGFLPSLSSSLTPEIIRARSHTEQLLCFTSLKVQINSMQLVLL